MVIVLYAYSIYSQIMRVKRRAEKNKCELVSTRRSKLITHRLNLEHNRNYENVRRGNPNSYEVDDHRHSIGGRNCRKYSKIVTRAPIRI